jgi:NAD(P)-dependent dehydrogenase (short-subunit alcohol dehydrogenase family)
MTRDALERGTGKMDNSKRALVTGAAQGIGLAVAERLAEDGWSLCLLDVLDSVREVAERLGSGSRAPGVVCDVGDVADESCCDAAVKHAVDEFGGLDALIHSAGIDGREAPVAELELDEFKKVIDVDLIGSFLMARACARQMIAQDSAGGIILISSTAAHSPSADDSAYSASKAGLEALMRSLALELAPRGVRVNAIAPGPIDIGMHRAWLAHIAGVKGTDFQTELLAVRKEIPLGRHGTGRDVAGVVAWLLSEDSSFVIGQTIIVDGGIHPS